MPSALLIAAQTAGAEIDSLYSQVETMEIVTGFEEEVIPAVNSQLSRYSITPTAADFTEFKSALLARLRAALSAAYTAFNSAYACLAYTTLDPVTELTLTEGSDPLKVTVAFTAASDAQTYKVYRSTVNDRDTAALIIETSETSYEDTGVAAATEYFYWVVSKATGLIDGTAVTSSVTTS